METIRTIKTIKTIRTDKFFIEKYIKDWVSLIKIANSELKKFGIMPVEFNSFFVSRIIFNDFEFEEIDKITKKLAKTFPKEDKKFNRVINKCQFHTKKIESFSNYDILMGLKKVGMFNPKKTNSFNICDYAIFEFENYIIIWHLDLYNGLGITINNIYRKEDIKFIKQFDKTINLDTI